MTGRALVIGVERDGLSGVENDVAVMADVLRAKGMLIETLIGPNATRAGIIDAYGRLIDATGSGDAAVVYYSGHGGRVMPPDGNPDAAVPDLMDMQFIVPADFHESTPDDFRGITSVELSVLLDRLTERTKNATVIFDCCHSGFISREDTTLRVKAINPLTPYGRLRAHIDRLNLPTGRLRSTGNHDAVRIVACAPEQSAFEYQGIDGKQIGVMTEALVLALRASDADAVTWAAVLDSVRRRTLALVPGQRPEVEGPAERRVFSAEVDEPLDTLRAVDLGSGRASLSCAFLLGVQPGDTFEVLSATGKRIGNLSVDRVGPMSAEGPVVFVPDVAQLPVGARARRLTAAAPALLVSLPDDNSLVDHLTRAIADEPMVRVASEDEPWSAQVRVGEEGDLTVWDRRGPVQLPQTSGDEGVEVLAKGAVDDLKKLARVAALRGLIAESRWSLGAPVTFEWGLVRGGERHRLANFGASVTVGDLVYIRVRNQGEQQVYVSLVDIGVTSRVSLLTNFAPTGVRLAPGKEYIFGYDDLLGVLTGVPITWPDDVQPVYARPETVLLFVTDDPQDLSALTQAGVRKADDALSPLAAVLYQVTTGSHRDLMRGPQGRAERYDVRALDFELDRGFLVEDRSAVGPAGPTSRGEAPTAVAVRVDELVVHRNRAMFGADIRVDVMVLTASPDSPMPVVATKTERFSRIRDGEALPLDRMLVYHGPVHEYLDIALWVSRDGAGALDLAELLTDEVTSFEVQEALARTAGSMTGVPYAAAAATIVGVGGVLVNAAYKLLRGSVSNAIGLYRGSMLAAEGFAVGRHPADGLRRIQDFSVVYTIDDVSPNTRPSEN